MALMILIGFFFYEKYFSIKKISEVKITLPKTENEEKLKKDTNSIKKPKYKVQLNESGRYEINAKSSEINYIDNIEIVSMNEVTAIFVDNKNRKIIVISDKAKFNTASYDTNFLGNTKITYLQNVITSEKLDFNYKTDDIIIYENVVFNGPHGAIKADNVKINLLTKNINIFMDNPKNKVKITSN